MLSRLSLRFAQAVRIGTAVEMSSLRWIVATGALAAVLAAVLFVGVVYVANRIHLDIIPALAPKLTLLDLEPALVFAGDSRTAQQVDPALVAEMLGKPRGYAVNIAAQGEDPAAVLAAARAAPGAFHHADLIMNLSPYHINDGSKREYFYSTPTIARLGLARELRTFVPSRPRTLVWYIQDTFDGAAAAAAPPPPPSPAVLLAGNLGYTPVAGNIVVFGNGHRYRDFLTAEIRPYERHSYFDDWQPDGFKVAVVRSALCDLRPLVHRLVIVAPPWAPIADLTGGAWRDRQQDFDRALGAIATACGFEFLAIDAIDGLGIGFFADEVHLNPEATPIYDSYLLRRLGYIAKRPGDRF